MLGILFLALVTVVPVKIGAHLFGANNKELKYCLIAVIIVTFIYTVSNSIIGGLPALICSFILISMLYSRIFGLTFSSAVGFTLVVILIQIGIVQALTDLGMMAVKSV